MRPPLQLVLLLFLISPDGAAAQQTSSRIAGPVSTPLIISPHARWAVRQPLALDSVPPEIRGGFLLGGVVGGVIGALIGGQFPKAPDS